VREEKPSVKVVEMKTSWDGQTHGGNVDVGTTVLVHANRDSVVAMPSVGEEFWFMRGKLPPVRGKVLSVARYKLTVQSEDGRCFLMKELSPETTPTPGTLPGRHQTHWQIASVDEP
jgi:hypothetical protein